MYHLYGIYNPVKLFNASLSTIPVQWSALFLDRAKYCHEQAVFVKQDLDESSGDFRVNAPLDTKVFRVSDNTNRIGVINWW